MQAVLNSNGGAAFWLVYMQAVLSINLLLDMFSLEPQRRCCFLACLHLGSLEHQLESIGQLRCRHDSIYVRGYSCHRYKACSRLSVNDVGAVGTAQNLLSSRASSLESSRALTTYDSLVQKFSQHSCPYRAPQVVRREADDVGRKKNNLQTQLLEMLMQKAEWEAMLEDEKEAEGEHEAAVAQEDAKQVAAIKDIVGSLQSAGPLQESTPGQEEQDAAEAEAAEAPSAQQT